ncbi:hypothetical protein TRFO_14757 [Tritrichomonas foetus]|uniref:Dynein regulatory complex subunit 2 n=1 Tax=Tritrichomonas foetus TaxID=1144522 RepID=A0A1J4KYN8_9EUKA|nr:hypothetical protein TRFO_14757 [Tritrichomonas foetus]|eukprot:OHT14822.1 hypothetical protein TRFO_14757 [Tritrichomonas foetus]
MPAKKRAARRAPDPNRIDLEKIHRIQDFAKRYEEFKNYELINRAAVEDKWRDILAYEKLNQQKLNIEVIKAKYTKQLDRCDSIISRLLQWLQEGEKQYQFALRSHKYNLELLTNLANKRLNFEHDRFESSLASISNEYDTNREKTLNEYNRHVSEVKDIINAIEHEYDLKNKELAMKHRQEEDSLKIKNQEMITTLKTHLMAQTDQVITASKVKYEDYKKRTEGRMHQFNVMLEKHQKRQKEMKLNEEHIIKNAAEIAHWRRKIRSNERESKEANDRLRQEKENLSLHFRELKEIMAKFRRIEAAKLAEISVAFEDINNDLANKLRLAEKILKFSEINREMETEKEQVLPFPTSVVETDPEIQRQMKQFKLQLKGDSKFVDESDLFDKFYRRYNKVLLDKLSLQREKAALMDHNQKLKTMVRKYMSGTAIAKDLMDNPNTLFIVNQETNAPMRHVDQEVIPVIEANLTLQANRLQGY